MGLATLDDRTPTSARTIEARWFAMPAAIKDKLARLETRKDMLHGAGETLRNRLLALRAELSEKTQRLKHALANASPETRVGVTGSDPWTGGSGSGVATYGGLPGPERQQEIDRLAEQLGRLDVLYRAAQERWQSAARIYQSCHEWLEGAELATLVPVVVKYEHLTDPRGEVEALRALLAALAEDAAAVERAPIPTAEALQRLDALARDVAARVEARRRERARAFLTLGGVRGVGGLYGLVEGFAEHARELAEKMVERCEEDFLAEQKAWRNAVQAQTIPGEPVAATERPKRLAELARKRHDLEQREEALVLSAEAAGLDLDRRGDADPAIVLCTVLADAAA